ncbi:DUF4260 family protein [Nocardiopsis sp. HNM0947]|uniref:DUF4260 family protein n=1 Tax=Nocardiopsis coralli TaxID=2772213 RepID=A0ABR9PBP7_9ACTN|nr:DUF4260 family protein [Nocardiopsis coralli]MBE3001268.1 DUF4260 family protein [Nocardiopsis coralli]
MAAEGPHRRAIGWQRAESVLVAVGIVMAVIVWGQPWWLLLAVFLVFDLSALGYLAGQRVGALCYNLVHNYAAPAVLVVGWAGLQLGGVETVWPLLLAACWGFHVAVDRALGYGLKLGPFTHTHLGTIGSTARDAST